MEYLERLLKKTGWSSLITSIVFAVLGIILVLNPEGTVKTVSYVIGGVFIVVGLTKIASYFLSKGGFDYYNYDLIYGIIAVVLGLITIFYSNTILTVLRIMIGIWIIYSSLIRIGFASKLKNESSNTWKIVGALAILMFIFGIYIVFNTNAIILTIGAVIIAYSIIDLVEGIIFLRSINKVF